MRPSTNRRRSERRKATHPSFHRSTAPTRPAPRAATPMAASGWTRAAGAAAVSERASRAVWVRPPATTERGRRMFVSHRRHRDQREGGEILGRLLRRRRRNSELPARPRGGCETKYGSLIRVGIPARAYRRARQKVQFVELKENWPKHKRDGPSSREMPCRALTHYGVQIDCVKSLAYKAIDSRGQPTLLDPSLRAIQVLKFELW